MTTKNKLQTIYSVLSTQDSKHISNSYLKLRRFLKSLKIQYVKKGDQINAKEIWLLETCLNAKVSYINVFKLISNSKFETAWDTLVNLSVTLDVLDKHITDDIRNLFSISFIVHRVFEIKMLFPYRVFASWEAVISDRVCSVCGKRRTIRDKCGHKLGEIYNGCLIYNIVQKVDSIRAISLVTDPFDERCKMQAVGEETDFENVKRLTRTVLNPFEIWKIKINKNDSKKGLISTLKKPSHYTPVSIVKRTFYNPKMYELSKNSMKLI